MDATLLSNLIWTGMLGLAAGNYATSWVHRVPKQESSFTRHPYCSTCETPLQVRDLFPLLSYLMLRGKCRYCEATIPSVYAWMEFWCALIFMVGIINYGWTEPYLYMLLGGCIALVFWGLEFCHKVVSANTLLALGAAGLIYRMSIDGSGYEALQGMIWGASLTALWWRGTRRRKAPDGDPVPIYIKLAAAAGIWMGSFGMLLMLVVWGMLEAGLRLASAIGKTTRHAPRTTSFVLALVVMMLHPNIVEQLQQVALYEFAEWMTGKEISAPASTPESP